MCEQKARRPRAGFFFTVVKTNSLLLHLYAFWVFLTPNPAPLALSFPGDPPCAAAHQTAFGSCLRRRTPSLKSTPRSRAQVCTSGKGDLSFARITDNSSYNLFFMRVVFFGASPITYVHARTHTHTYTG